METVTGRGCVKIAAAEPTDAARIVLRTITSNTALWPKSKEVGMVPISSIDQKQRGVVIMSPEKIAPKGKEADSTKRR